ncbi:MAG: DUF1080 domain-containing protein, partial [Flavobacteriaceae bacterium]|nr:DUF1080 domain-containing protein [Flavobacteriaceae bacterium]
MEIHNKIIFFYIFLISIFPCMAQESEQNTLSVTEKENGWKLLFDGKTSKGWRGYNSNSFPSSFWEIEDGVLSCVQIEDSGKENLSDLITIDQYENFELKLDWKISKGANSGIMYFASE